MATAANPAPTPTAGKDLYGKDLAQYIFEREKSLGRDPLPALSIIPHEGGFSGAVGDQGTSFGPWQLHIGGALPKSIAASQAQAWANSPAGIDYALGGINNAVGSAQGTNAVSAIVYKFERPADPATESEKAIGTYYALGADKGNAADWTSFTGSGALAALGGGATSALKTANQVASNPFAAAGLGWDALVGGSGSGIAKWLGIPQIPKNAVTRGAEIVAGSVLVLLAFGIIGFAAVTRVTAPVQPVARATRGGVKRARGRQGRQIDENRSYNTSRQGGAEPQTRPGFEGVGRRKAQPSARKAPARRGEGIPF